MREVREKIEELNDMTRLAIRGTGKDIRTCRQRLHARCSALESSNPHLWWGQQRIGTPTLFSSPPHKLQLMLKLGTSWRERGGGGRERESEREREREGGRGEWLLETRREETPTCVKSP